MNAKLQKIIVSIIVLIAAFFCFQASDKTLASASGPVINEIFPAPISGSSETEEWVEIYDPNGLMADIGEYSLTKITGSGTEYTKQLSASICTDFSNYLTCSFASGWLANTGSTLILRRGPGENLDRVTYGSFSTDAPVPSSGGSVSRIPNGSDTDSDFADFRIVPITKGEENKMPSPVVYSDKIEISEICPEPASGPSDEFIELFNSGPEAIDLSGWLIDDIESGGSSPHAIADGTIIRPNEYLAFYNSTTKIAFNDTGDSARLLDPDGNIKASISYDKANRGQSFSSFAGSWIWSLKITPGAENILETENQDQDISNELTFQKISEIKSLPDGDEVLIQGAVGVPPGILSNQYFYIQDETAGIQIYLYSKQFPLLSFGTLVQIAGEMSTVSGERRIKISDPNDITILAAGAVPSPVILTIDELSEKYVGMAIQIEGTVTKTSGSVFYLHGSGEVKILINALTGIKKPKMRVGNKVRVYGILTAYKGSLRLLPYEQSGVIILDSGALPETGCDRAERQNNIFEIWNSRQLQPMKRKRLVNNLPRP